MKELRNKQRKVSATLFTTIPQEIMAGLEEAKWRERKSKNQVVIELLQSGLREKLGDEFFNKNNTEVQI